MIIQPVLTHGMNYTYFRANRQKLFAYYSMYKVLKSELAVRHSSNNTPLLQALRIHTVSEIIEPQELSLFKAAMLSDPRTSSFNIRRAWANVLSNRKFTAKGRDIRFR